MQLGLGDKVVLVTGKFTTRAPKACPNSPANNSLGGTKGIGLAIVKSFLQEGAIVHFCSRTGSEVVDAEKALASTHGADKVYGYTVDISSANQVTQWVKECASVSGNRIDVLVSNVSALSVANTRQSWDATYQTDIMGTYTLIEAALPYLKETKGNIVAISTVSSRYVDFTAPGPYGAIKAALIHYISQLAHTLAPHGVRANCVSPGNIYIEDGFWAKIETGKPEFFQKQIENNPMGRMGTAEEVADSVVWLASNKAGFVSGTNLLVDGAVSPGVQF